MRTFKELKRISKEDYSQRSSIKISLVGDSATQFLATSLIGMGKARGFNVELYEAEYNQVERQILDPTSDLHSFGADYTIIFQSTHKLLEKYVFYEQDARNSIAEERIAFLCNACSLLKGKVIVYNYPEIEDTIFGSYANKVKSSFTYQVRKLNFEMMNLCQSLPNLFICDICGLYNKYGRNYCFDSTIYMSTEMLLSIDFLPYIASRTWDIICAAQGEFKKCLILDLDNTLWGGVVGDDGWENIQIGHGLGIGKAFTEFQEWIKKLQQRGIILAICSKNDEEKAKEPFEKNPEMVLKLNDIAVFIANWENKVDNIRKIQSILNIGFDSMVFLDDNPFERTMVKENIPDITVPELPEDPGEYLEYIYSLNLFETISYNKADMNRTKQYQVEFQRVSLQQSFTNEADFLKSLEMRSVVKGFDSFNIPRVAQLSQRSNQFNLRTKRYTEADILKMEKSNSYANFSFTLEDKFGDNGLICVVILEKKDNDTLFIDTWFMSCRVLKRGMENFTLNTIVCYAMCNGFRRIIGEYLPTSKNQMVADHYSRLGFMKIDNSTQYELRVSEYVNKECYIKIV